MQEEVYDDELMNAQNRKFTRNGFIPRSLLSGAFQGVCFLLRGLCSHATPSRVRSRG